MSTRSGKRTATSTRSGYAREIQYIFSLVDYYRLSHYSLTLPWVYRTLEVFERVRIVSPELTDNEDEIDITATVCLAWVVKAYNDEYRDYLVKHHGVTKKQLREMGEYIDMGDLAAFVVTNQPGTVLDSQLKAMLDKGEITKDQHDLKLKERETSIKEMHKKLLSREIKIFIQLQSVFPKQFLGLDMAEVFASPHFTELWRFDSVEKPADYAGPSQEAMERLVARHMQVIPPSHEISLSCMCLY